jgi:hypothetical protein
MLGISPEVLTNARAEAAYSNFSIDDYDKVQGPYQIVMPAYPTPVWLQKFSNMTAALRECGTLCTLRGRPFRLMAWSRSGSGARGGVPCAQCKKTPNPSRFARPVCRCKNGAGFLQGFPDAHPIAEFRPGGQRLVYDASGNAKLVGKPDYAVSRTPFPRVYNDKPVYPQQYMEAIRMGVQLANRNGQRVFVCSGFGQDCKKKVGVPVVYVDPGSYVRRYNDMTPGTVAVNNVSPEYFQELVEESRGGTYLGQGA